MKQLITVVIQTYNEQNNIAACISSARLLTNDIIVVDTQSTDNTKQYALKEGVVVYEHEYEQLVEPVRNFAIEKAHGEWIFLLDADERITEELAAEVKHVVAETTHTHYKLPRKDFFAQKVWLQYGGWWPNTIIRLIKKDCFIDWPKAIHSTPKVKGSCGILVHALLHYSKNDYGIIVEKTSLFEDMESNLLFAANKPVNTMTFFRKFFGELYRRLIKKQGYRDGTIGVIESVYQAYSKTITYLYLYEKKKSTAL